VTERLVVIGGDAAGMSAASQARRRRSDLEIVVYERSGWVSYSACGEPYHVAGYVDPLERLVARTPEQFAERGVEVHTNHEVTAIDLDSRDVTVRTPDGEGMRQGFDILMIATGATAIRPGISGIELDGITELRTLDDAARLREIAESNQARVTIVGGGYIGLEVAEAFSHRGWDVTVITSGKSVLERALDTDMGDIVIESMRDAGMRVITDLRIRCINGTHRVESVGCEKDGDEFVIPADLVVLGLGSRPESELAAEAGIPLGETDAIKVDDRQRTGVDGVWSAGDCAEVKHRVTAKSTNVHLGTVANKTGRVAGINIGGGDVVFPGVLGTAITKVCSLEIASTGLRLSEALAAGFDAVAGTASGTTTAGYWPTASELAIRAVAERGSGRLLGAQIVGGPGGGKRIDTFATAIWQEMSAEELSWLDLAYAPPFSGVWDLIHIAARKASEAG